MVEQYAQAARALGEEGRELPWTVVISRRTHYVSTYSFGIGSKSVGAGASVLNTDEWGGYVRVESRMGIAHRTECAMEATRTGAESGHATTMETVLGKSLHWQRLGGCSGAPLRTFS